MKKSTILILASCLVFTSPGFAGMSKELKACYKNILQTCFPEKTISKADISALDRVARSYPEGLDEKYQDYCKKASITDESMCAKVQKESLECRAKP